MTNNIERRLIEHNKGYNKSTKSYAPYLLIFQEQATNRIEARVREKYRKSGIGKKRLKQL